MSYFKIGVLIIIVSGILGRAVAQDDNPPLSPHELALQGVTHNADWKPHSETINGLEMVLVPAGCFMMGSTQAQVNDQVAQAIGEEWASRQLPLHQKCLVEPFWIDQTPISQTDYTHLGGIKATPNYFQGDQRPVEMITWFEAQDFCELRGLRLPTEVEWEYAARGVDSLIYPWGNEWEPDYLVWAENSNGQTAIVASVPDGISWVGALDMSGNVWEWTSSPYEPYPYDEEDGRENTTDDGNVYYVLRGGSWDYPSMGYFPAAIREVVPPAVYSYDLGFRCVRDYE